MIGINAEKQHSMSACCGNISWVSFWKFLFSLPFYIILAATATAKSLQLCPTLCDPIDSSPPGSPVPGILQARVLEWVAISSSNAWKWKVKEKLLSCVRLVATPWTAAHQALPSMGFSRQEYWNGVPLLLNCGVGENSWESLGLQGDQTSPS